MARRPEHQAPPEIVSFPIRQSQLSLNSCLFSSSTMTMKQENIRKSKLHS